MSDHDPSRRASEFLRAAHLYRLGELPTEQPHEETRDLSLWARTDLPRALDALRRVDLRALDRLLVQADAISALAAEVRATLDRGARVFLCGCGATGRLALSLEYLWRRRGQDVDRLVAFMAGGDVALVHSLEGFEDDPCHGARHLRELGFGEKDLLIACTEGGETPYVIGAVEAAASISSTPPWFLYCNPDEALLRTGSRFDRVHADSRVRKASLYVGPMALAGSTRMQASTALQLAVGAALLHPERSPVELVRELSERLRAIDLAFLEGFVADEAEIYRRGEHLLYRVRDYGITVFTDTTERAPTFSLPAFERASDPQTPLSPCYVQLDDAQNAADAWVRLLARAPRPLDWPEVDPRATPVYLAGFDFGPRGASRRREAAPDRAHEFRIGRRIDAISLALDERSHEVPLRGAPELIQHLLLKQMLNMHSTLVLGRLGRYDGNLMTWVTPTNGKLVDRAARHVRHLLAHAGEPERTYEEIVLRLFAEIDRAAPGESVVVRTFRALARSASVARAEESRRA
jgi:N-acetylmuramic acid 6-phosphate etherase